MTGTGPHLAAALICERTLQEQDGTISMIRVVDRVTFLQNPQGELLQPQQPVTLVVMLKSGEARGSYKVQVRQEKPSGEDDQVLETAILLEGEDRGVNLIVNLGWEPDQAGLYWFDVFFEGERVTRMPLRAVFQPLPKVGPDA
jgi:hypothetical protein